MGPKEKDNSGRLFEEDMEALYGTPDETSEDEEDEEDDAKKKEDYANLLA
jgi:hypothetical protein